MDMLYSLMNNPFEPFPMFGKPSVYVISDSELAKYKRLNAEAEISEIQRLIDSHKQSIERLQKTVDKLTDELPPLPEETAKEWQH